jgi:hypothetical protein
VPKELAYLVLTVEGVEENPSVARTALSELALEYLVEQQVPEAQDEDLCRRNVPTTLSLG